MRRDKRPGVASQRERKVWAIFFRARAGGKIKGLRWMLQKTECAFRFIRNRRDNWPSVDAAEKKDEDVYL